MWWGGKRREGGGRRLQMEKRQNLAAFWALGVLNNVVYVIMLAGAKGEGGKEGRRESDLFNNGSGSSLSTPP